jgi:hypothetical protein
MITRNDDADDGIIESRSNKMCSWGQSHILLNREGVNNARRIFSVRSPQLTTWLMSLNATLLQLQQFDSKLK